MHKPIYSSLDLLNLKKEMDISTINESCIIEKPGIVTVSSVVVSVVVLVLAGLETGPFLDPPNLEQDFEIRFEIRFGRSLRGP